MLMFVSCPVLSLISLAGMFILQLPFTLSFLLLVPLFQKIKSALMFFWKGKYDFGRLMSGQLNDEPVEPLRSLRSSEHDHISSSISEAEQPFGYKLIPGGWPSRAFLNDFLDEVFLLGTFRRPRRRPNKCHCVSMSLT